MDYTINPIGYVSSSIKDRETAPKMEDEKGAVRAVITINADVSEGLDGLKEGDWIELITWFHESKRDTLKVHPRGKKELPQRGVFSTRSPFRPNPVGLHRVQIVGIEGNRLEVEPLEAIDGTPVVDIKPFPKKFKGKLKDLNE